MTCYNSRPKTCDCCGHVAVDVERPKVKDWTSVATCCDQCDVRENEDTWVVHCLTHGKVLYSNEETG